MDAEDVQRQINQTIQESNNEILSQFSSILDSRLSTVQQNINETQKVIAERQEAKFEQVFSDGYKFKKRGNEEQHKHNVKVMAKLKEANEELEENRIQGVRQKISEGYELIKQRQKLIKLADSSVAGWRAVDEYVKNPIASDSEDEKRISKAQTRAERKVKDERLRRRRDLREKSRPYPSINNTSSEANTSTTTTAGVWRSGQCYKCHRRGHWRKDCTEKMDDKISRLALACFDKSHSSETNTGKSPVGRLKKNLGQWRSIEASRFVLNVIQYGYRLPFFTIPSSVELKNNKSALDNAKFVSSEIQKLLDKGCVQEVREKPKVVNPLTVAGNKQKQRLVLDARHVNPHLFKYKHKYEDASTSRELFQKGDYIFSFDLKSAYHHIMIANEDREYLGFQWRDKYYVFNVLPFGISTAGYIFTKVLRDVVKFWRSKGYKIVMYLDDGIGGAKSLDRATMVSEKIQTDLNSLGFLVAEDKCQWKPVQEIIWLGLVWNTEHNKISVSSPRIDKLKASICHIMEGFKAGFKWFEVRFIASLIGQIISTHAVFGDVVRLRTRYLYYCILSKSSWNANITLSEEAFGELQFWLQNVESMNEKGTSLSKSTYNDIRQIEIYCDASDSGYGGHLTLCSKDEQREFEWYGVWNEWESKSSSTWREIETVKRILCDSADLIKNKSVEIN